MLSGCCSWLQRLFKSFIAQASLSFTQDPIKSAATLKNPMDFSGKIKIFHSHPCFSMFVLCLSNIYVLLQPVEHFALLMQFLGYLRTILFTRMLPDFNIKAFIIVVGMKRDKNLGSIKHYFGRLGFMFGQIVLGIKLFEFLSSKEKPFFWQF